MGLYRDMIRQTISLEEIENETTLVDVPVEAVAADPEAETIVEEKIEPAVEIVEEAISVAEDLEEQIEVNEELIDNQPEVITDEVVATSREMFAYSLGRLNWSREQMKHIKMGVESASTPVAKLRISTESMKDTVKNIAAKIWEAIKKVGEWLKKAALWIKSKTYDKFKNWFKKTANEVEAANNEVKQEQGEAAAIPQEVIDEVKKAETPEAAGKAGQKLANEIKKSPSASKKIKEKRKEKIKEGNKEVSDAIMSYLWEYLKSNDIKTLPAENDKLFNANMRSLENVMNALEKQEDLAKQAIEPSSVGKIYESAVNKVISDNSGKFTFIGTTMTEQVLEVFGVDEKGLLVSFSIENKTITNNDLMEISEKLVAESLLLVNDDLQKVIMRQKRDLDNIIKKRDNFVKKMESKLKSDENSVLVKNIGFVSNRLILNLTKEVTGKLSLIDF